jgi:hypothetical protein
MSGLPKQADNRKITNLAPDKNGGFSWEKTDLAAAIKSAVK